MISDLLGTNGTGTVTGVDISKHRAATCRSLLKKYRIGRARLFVTDGTTFGVRAPSFLDPLRQGEGNTMRSSGQNRLGEGLSEDLTVLAVDSDNGHNSASIIKPFW